jgi:ribosomal protein S21
MSDQREFKKPITLPENVPIDYTFERMLKNFMKEVDKSGILREVKARRYYIKKSELKRLAKKTRRD